MAPVPFDTLARQAAAVHNRRASLTALGATLLAAAATAPFAATTDAKKKKKTKISKDVKKVCAQQVAACQNGWQQACDGNETCLSLATCCSFLKTCDAAGQIKCITDIL